MSHDRAHLQKPTGLRISALGNTDVVYHAEMEGMIAGRTAGDMPGLDIAEQRSWQNFLDSALRMYANLNRALVEAHQLTLNDVRLLDILDRSPTGSARMGDLAEGLMSLPSRVTRQIRRLEVAGLVRRGASPDDGRGVLATITDEGRLSVRQAMVTYGEGVRGFSRQAVASPDRRDGRELPSHQRRAQGNPVGREGRQGQTPRLTRGGVAERPNALALKARDG